MNVLGIIIGIAICYFSSNLVGWILKKSTDNIDLFPPEGILIDEWNNVVKEQQTGEAGKWLGKFERVLIFISAWIGEYTIIAAWLVFKVGSKWEVWSNIVKVPNSIEQSSTLSYLKARRAWGARLLSRFLIGTISNILIGFATAPGIKYILSQIKT